MFKLCFFVPEAYLEEVKSAVFLAGAGRLGDYDSCCWQTKGAGQFRPLSGSAPFVGQQDQLEKVEEWKVEVVCEALYIREAIEALIKSHPYEVPAYDVVRLEVFD